MAVSSIAHNYCIYSPFADKNLCLNELRMIAIFINILLFIN